MFPLLSRIKWRWRTYAYWIVNGIGVALIAIQLQLGFNLEAQQSLAFAIAGMLLTDASNNPTSEGQRLKNGVLRLLLVTNLAILVVWTVTANGSLEAPALITSVLYSLISGLFNINRVSESRSQDERNQLLERVTKRTQAFLEPYLVEDNFILLHFHYVPDKIDPLLLHTDRPSPKGEGRLSALLEYLPDEDLLILGKGGAGKSITLYKLVEAYSIKATIKPSARIPVIFSLTDWSRRQQPLDEWLSEWLVLDYQVGSAVARNWIQQLANEKVLLPCLDGFDEVPEEARPLCALAINEFREKYKCPLIITSREDEYDAQAQSEKFRLAGHAITLAPLHPTQIEDYLNQFSNDPRYEKTREVWEQIREFNLIQTPLLLSIFVRMAEHINFSFLEEAIDLRPRRLKDEFFKSPPQPLAPEALALAEKELLHQYTDYNLSDSQNDRTPLNDEARHVLLWLARKMQHYNATLFYVETLQPQWLASHGWRWFYVILSRLLGAILVGVGIGWFFSTPLDFVPVGILAGLVIGSIDGMRFHFAGPTTFTNRWKRLGWQSLNILLVFVCVSLVLIVYFSLVENHPAHDMLFNGLIATSEVFHGIFPSFFYGAIFGLRGSRQSASDDIKPIEKLEFHYSSALRGGANYGLIVGLAIGSIAAMVGAFAPAGTTGEWIRDHFAVVEHVVFNWFLLGFGLAAVFGAAFGVMASGYEARSSDKSAPAGVSDALRLSIQNAFTRFLTFTLVFALLFGILFGWLAQDTDGIWRGLADALALGIFAFSWYGGLDLLQHTILRVTFYLRGFPFHYLRTLDAIKKSTLLLREGRGFRFYHAYVHEYLASKAIAPDQPEETRQAIAMEQLQSGRFNRMVGWGGAVVIMVLLLFFLQSPVYEYLIPAEAVAVAGAVSPPNMCLRAGETVDVHTMGSIKVGSFVGYTRPEGKEVGFLGLPIDETYNLVETLPHGALLCRLRGQGDGEGQLCAQRTKPVDHWYAWRTMQWTAPSDGCLELYINDTEIENNSGTYWVTVSRSSLPE